MQFRSSDIDILETFGRHANPRIDRVNIQRREVRFLEAGTQAGTLFLFIHGAPGSMGDYVRFLNDPDLLARGRLVSFDRPGYGYSGFGEAERSMEEHARIAAEIIQKLRGADRVVVIGHSYGGTVALRMAADYPGLVDRYLLLAASTSAEHERIFWFNRPASWGIVRWAVPKAWRVANTEKMSQIGNLDRLDLRLDRIKDPILAIHGDADPIVPVEHTYSLSERLNDPPLQVRIWEGINHFLIWKNYDRVKSLFMDWTKDLIPAHR